MQPQDNDPKPIEDEISKLLSLVVNAAIKYQAAKDGEPTLEAARYLEADRKQAKQRLLKIIREARVDEIMRFPYSKYLNNTKMYKEWRMTELVNEQEIKYDIPKNLHNWLKGDEK